MAGGQAMERELDAELDGRHVGHDARERIREHLFDTHAA